jgi:hypothetical protein
MGTPNGREQIEESFLLMKDNVTVSAPYMCCWVPKPGHFGKQTSNTLDVKKCGAGEGWSGSAGPIV